MLSMVTFGILRIEAQTWTWTFDNKNKHAWKKIDLKYMSIYISFVVYNTCLSSVVFKQA